MDKVTDQLLMIIRRELHLEPGQVTTASRLADLGDSLDQVALLTEIEDAFEIRISDEQSRTLVTVADLLWVVARAPANAV